MSKGVLPNSTTTVRFPDGRGAVAQVPSASRFSLNSRTRYVSSPLAEGPVGFPCIEDLADVCLSRRPQLTNSVCSTFQRVCNAKPHRITGFRRT